MQPSMIVGTTQGSGRVASKVGVQIVEGAALNRVSHAELAAKIRVTPLPVFADSMSLLGWLERLPRRFRDLALEFELSQMGHGPKPANVPVVSRKGRYRFDPGEIARHPRAATVLLDELERRGLIGIYEGVELPFVRLAWRMVNHGPLISVEPLAVALHQFRDIAERVMRSTDLLSGRLCLPLGWSSTGRVYTRGGYLQNLPAALRRAVVAPPGHVLMEVDYRHMDLVMLAALSRDRELLRALREGRDLHMLTAELVADGQTPDRNTGKLFNFAVLYGVTDSRLAQMLGATQLKAAMMKERFWSGLTGASRWRDDICAQSLSPPHTLRNPFGRVGWFPQAEGTDRELASVCRRAISFMCQATAADVFKRGLLRLAPKLDSAVKIVLTVHDSVLLEVPQHLVRNTGIVAQDQLEAQLPELEVPLRVEVSVGPNWGAMEAKDFRGQD